MFKTHIKLKFNHNKKVHLLLKNQLPSLSAILICTLLISPIIGMLFSIVYNYSASKTESFNKNSSPYKNSEFIVIKKGPFLPP